MKRLVEVAGEVALLTTVTGVAPAAEPARAR